MTTFSTLYDAINFYYMPLLYIMGKNIINNTNNSSLWEEMGLVWPG